jgi:histidinol-phosphate/aromatic aminotransferase/cobyric acid decarboxylase-like protein
MKFTTSYDWAMLGVKAVLELDDKHRGCKAHYPFEQYYRNLMKDSHRYPDNQCPINMARLRHYTESTPEQITRAWVEVLEDAS